MLSSDTNMNNFLTVTSGMVLVAIRLPEAILDCVLTSSGALMGTGSGLIDNVLGKFGRAVVNLAPRFLRVPWYFPNVQHNFCRCIQCVA